MEPLKNQHSIEKINSYLEPYTKIIDGKLVIDILQAHENNVPYDLLEMAKEINDFSDLIAKNKIQRLLPKEDKQTSETNSCQNCDGDSESPDKYLTLPGYGNWCGPLHGGGVPINILDNGCKNHDKCYERQGYFACSCDKSLINYIDKNIYKMGIKEAAVALTIRFYFAHTACNPLA